MADERPLRRVRPVTALVVGAALALIAANGPWLVERVRQLFTPPPNKIIIVAPSDSETV